MPTRSNTALDRLDFQNDEGVKELFDEIKRATPEEATLALAMQRIAEIHALITRPDNGGVPYEAVVNGLMWSVEVGKTLESIRNPTDPEPLERVRQALSFIRAFGVAQLTKPNFVDTEHQQRLLRFMTNEDIAPEFADAADKAAIGELCRALRKAKGMTQIEAADRMETKQSRISDLERGEGTVSMSYYCRYAEMLGSRLRVIAHQL